MVQLLPGFQGFMYSLQHVTRPHVFRGCADVDHPIVRLNLIRAAPIRRIAVSWWDSLVCRLHGICKQTGSHSNSDM